GELLWYAAGTKGYAPSGRSGIPIEWRVSPSSGGLHPIHIVCVPPPHEDGVILYDSFQHQFGRLKLDARAVVQANAESVAAVVGESPGWTLRFIADFDKISAAYENAWSLVLRDAGCLIMTICLCAEWLGLSACPLGFLGQALCVPLGFPGERFKAVGGVHLTSPA
ncbi:MAG: hypothetical protein EPN26_02920, partial [Rhodospirillales bacterium]